MSLNPALVSAYRFHRQAQRPSRVSHRVNNGTGFAQVALRLAYEDVAAGKARYPYDGKPYAAVSWAQRDESTFKGGKLHSITRERLAYVQSIEGAGLRHVGDVVCDTARGVWNNRGESGWLTDPYGDVSKDGTGLCWGVVYQLAARNGKARFVAGYIMGGCSDDLPTVDFGTVFEENARGGYNDSPQDYDAARDAARAADSMAQKAAEEEREYQTAWQAGSRYGELGAQVAEWRKAIIALGRDRRKARGAGEFPAICDAVRKAMTGLASDIAEARQERAALANGDGERNARENYLSFWPGDARLRAAFNEGAGSTVL